MKQRVRQTHVEGLLLRCGFVVLMVGLIAFSLYQLGRHVTVGAQTLRTQTITDRSYMQLNLYLFRDEEVLVANEADRLFVYRVGDGEKVGVGDTLAQVYATGQNDSQRRETQVLLNAAGKQLALLERQTRVGAPTDAEEALKAVDQQYIGLLAAVDRGQLGVADGFAEQMMEEINRYQTLTGTSEAKGNTIKYLKEQQRTLVADASYETDVITDKGGYFYYDVDGYETRFAYDRVLTMTPNEFLGLIQENAQPVPDTQGTVVGKLVKSSVWYAAAYVTQDEAAYLKEGYTYTLTCRNSAGVTLPMTVCRVVPNADDGGALVVFKTRYMPEGFSYDRRLSVQMVSDEISGYRVPAEAIVTRTNEQGQNEEGVYILVGNVVEFRRILTRRTYEGYRIVRTRAEVVSYLEEIGEGDTAGEYLTLNDLIILTPSGLAEGDMLR